MDNEKQQIHKDMMIVSAQYPSIVLELIKLNMIKTPLIGDNQFSTIVNAITLETQSNLLISVQKSMEEIKNGSLFNTQ